MVVAKPFTIFYTIEDGNVIVHLRGRHEDGTKAVYRVKGCEPSFYAEAIPGIDDKVKRVEKDAAISLDGRDVNRIITYYPKQVKEIRSHFEETWEADVLFENRVRYDLGIRNRIKVRQPKQKKATITTRDIKPIPGQDFIAPRLINTDIETDGSNDVDNPSKQVTSISSHDSQTNRYITLVDEQYAPLKKKDMDWLRAKFKDRGWDVVVYGLDGERALFQAFNKMMNKLQPDIMTGWFVDEFDQQYLANRAVRMRFPYYDWRQLEVFDCMDAYERLHEGELKSRALQYVAMKEGVGGKTNIDDKGYKKSVTELTPRELVFYNLNDVYLVKAINDKRNLVNFFLSLTNYAGCGIGDALTTGRLVDSYILHETHGQIVWPTKVKHKKDKFKGAHVFPPSKGLFHKVVEHDNSGEYAAVMQTFNLSPETRVK